MILFNDIVLCSAKVGVGYIFVYKYIGEEGDGYEKIAECK